MWLTSINVALICYNVLRLVCPFYISKRSVITFCGIAISWHLRSSLIWYGIWNRIFCNDEFRYEKGQNNTKTKSLLTSMCNEMFFKNAPLVHSNDIQNGYSFWTVFYIHRFNLTIIVVGLHWCTRQPISIYADPLVMTFKEFLGQEWKFLPQFLLTFINRTFAQAESFMIQRQIISYQ